MPRVGTPVKSRGVSCAVHGCESRFYKQNMSRSPFHFFPYPAKHKLRDRWCLKIKKNHDGNKFYRKDIFVCNLHFKAEDFTRSLTGKLKLIPGAEPINVTAETKSQRKEMVPQGSTDDHADSCVEMNGNQPLDDGQSVAGEKDKLNNELQTDTDCLEAQGKKIVPPRSSLQKKSTNKRRNTDADSHVKMNGNQPLDDGQSVAGEKDKLNNELQTDTDCLEAQGKKIIPPRSSLKKKSTTKRRNTDADSHVKMNGNQPLDGQSVAGEKDKLNNELQTDTDCLEAQGKKIIPPRSSLNKKSTNKRRNTDADSHVKMNGNQPLDDGQCTVDAKDKLNNELKAENARLRAQVSKLERSFNRAKIEKYEQSKFINTLEKDDSLTKHHTGFPTFSLLLAMLSFLDPEINMMMYSSNTCVRSEDAIDFDHNYAGAKETQNKPEIRPDLTSTEQFILVLCRLRQGFSLKHLGYLFGISESTVGSYVSRWINFMYDRLTVLSIWPSKDAVLKNMPQIFRDKYPDTRVVLGCSEICAEVPDSVTQQSIYKHHVSYKSLLGVAPRGEITFVSKLQPASVSKRELVIRSGFLNPSLFKEDDVVMTDQGFTIEDLLEPMNVKLDTPAFLKGRGQFKTQETHKTQHMEAERIHVERAIDNVKQFRILDSPIDGSLHESLNQIWTVCCLLTHFYKVTGSKKDFNSCISYH
ncbi:uncharacterized protein [Asterias amurensis]|uniref:uncharacterized protein n=1 Tax=Asterias amurensis TaxID=7602 RepID=UPI003AB40C7D